ncbi:MAG: hypothetical protein KatS3mg101_0083 [Patescibacteria group bacterium]|nr:MAG: hypothetical protein KatS3mg101_0083 [Patescibacteria group bacterium]
MKPTNYTLYVYVPVLFLLGLLTLGTTGILVFSESQTGIVNSEKQQRIAEGTTYTETFSKDGNTVVVTKTYKIDGVYITTKTYDGNGNLIGQKSRVNPLPSQVYVYRNGDTSQPTNTSQPTQPKPTLKQNVEVPSDPSSMVSEQQPQSPELGSDENIENTTDRQESTENDMLIEKFETNMPVVDNLQQNERLSVTKMVMTKIQSFFRNLFGIK